MVVLLKAKGTMRNHRRATAAQQIHLQHNNINVQRILIRLMVVLNLTSSSFSFARRGQVVGRCIDKIEFTMKSSEFHIITIGSGASPLSTNRLLCGRLQATKVEYLWLTGKSLLGARRSHTRPAWMGSRLCQTCLADMGILSLDYPDGKNTLPTLPQTA